MTYKVYCDNYLLYSNKIESLKIFEPRISMELNKVGSFTFTIYPDHPYFNRLQKLKSVITVYQDDVLIFRGRILNDINGFYNEKQITCESDLAFLLDSIQRPYEFQGTPAELFTQFLTSHNAQVDEEHRFNIGTITVTDPNNYINRSDSTYQNTFDAIEDKLIDGLGGYLHIRYESDGPYIDYLKDLNWLSPQTIEFGKNLIELTKTVKADDVFTVIIPIGASITDSSGQETGERMTIESVNDGKDYLENTDAISKYGRIVKMIEWSDVTVPSILKTKGQKYLDESVLLINNIELSAADLSSVDKDILSFHIGTKVHVISKPHGIDSYFLVDKLALNLSNPADNKLSLGATFTTITDTQKNNLKSINSVVTTIINGAVTDVIAKTTKELQSTIQTTSESILSTVSENCYLKSETDDLVSSVQTSLEQTAYGFTMQFESMSKDINDVVKGTDAEFENFRKYIRFVDGKILLGEVGNALELQISNDRIKFIQDNSEVAYFSNNKLYVVDGEFTNSMQLGKFAFLPRTSGNLSFKKVRD